MVGITGGSFIPVGGGGVGGGRGSGGGGGLATLSTGSSTSGGTKASMMAASGGGGTKQSLTARSREARAGKSRIGPKGPGAVLEKVLGITTEKNVSVIELPGGRAWPWWIALSC